MNSDNVKNTVETFRKETGKFLDRFFNFDASLTPVLVRLLFYFGTIVSILSALSTRREFWDSRYSRVEFHWDHIIQFIFLLIILPVILRIACEMIMVLFKIQEHLYDIRNKK